MDNKKFINHKTSRKNFSPENIKNDDIVINISLSNKNNIKSENNINYYKSLIQKKTPFQENLEKIKINYGKCNFNSDKSDYKIKKINLDIPIIPKNYTKYVLFSHLFYYKNKQLLFIGHSFNLIVHEIYTNNSIFITSLYNNIIQNNEKITKIFLLEKSFSLSNKIHFIVIINKRILLYEYNFIENKFTNMKNILLDNNNNSVYKYKFKLIKNTSKMIIYTEKSLAIYDIFMDKYKYIDIDLIKTPEDNIKLIQNFSNNLYILITDKLLIILDGINETFLHKIDIKINFNWNKILLLKNNQFLFYSDSNISLYKYDFDKKIIKPEFIKELNLSNVKNINKIIQINNNDLIIFYESFNLAVFDMKFDLIKYKKIGKDVNYICKDLFQKEIRPNTIVYKTDLWNIHFFDAIKGNNLGCFGVKKNNILAFKEIKKKYIPNNNLINQDKANYYFILAGNSSYILSFD